MSLTNVRWLTASSPADVRYFIRVSPAEHVDRSGGATVDTWHAILTRDKSWWVSVCRGRKSGFQIVREKYRTAAAAAERAEQLQLLAQAGSLDQVRRPLLLWRRWGRTPLLPDGDRTRE